VGLTLACDFRWAAAEAQLWIPEVDLGVPLGVASTTRFVRLVGPARAKEIIMECRRYSAAEAQTWASCTVSSPARRSRRRCARTRTPLAASRSRPWRGQGAINAIARTGIPEVNAMTEDSSIVAEGAMMLEGIASSISRA